jgi:tetratricopeptide (TPR) repeat protein
MRAWAAHHEVAAGGRCFEIAMSVKNPKVKSVDEKVSFRQQSGAWPRWFVPLVIFLLTFVVFFPALQNGFVNWDDDENLLGNPSYRGLGWPQLRWMFTTFHGGHYQPLTWVTFGLDYLLWGMSPFGYHLTSLILHACNAVLFYFVALCLLSVALSKPTASMGILQLAAGFAALLFAIHPLRVESVVWATERRDVLSGLFLLLSILCYLRANALSEGGVRARWMAAAVVVYGLSLLSKAIGVTLPIVLLVLDVSPLRRLGGSAGDWFGLKARKVFIEKIPFFLPALAAALIAPMAQGGVMRSLHEYGVVSRLSQSLFGLAFYLWKTVLPLGLSPLYEVPVDFNPLNWRFLLSGLIVLLISLGLFVLRHRWPAGLASWVCYVVILSPVLGITQSGPQIAADRYSYLSCLGWAILAGAGLFYCWQGWLRGAARAVVPALGLVGIVVLGILTWKQVHVWHDSIRLWEHALAITEDSYFKSSIAHGNLGVALVSRGELKKAVQHYRDALRIDPANAEAHNNLGVALLEQGELGEAIEHYREALRINSDYAEAHYNLGNVLVRRGEIDEAVEHYRAALRTRPADAKAHYNLGTILARKGQLEEAMQHFRQALEIDPAYAMAHYNLGTALAIRGDLEGAIDHFQQALRLNPSSSEMHFGLGNVLATRGDFDEAVVHLRRAVRIQPDFAEAHEGLGRALAQQGKREEAVKHYQEALRIMKSRQEVGASK